MHAIVFNYNHISFNNVWIKNENRERGHLLRNSEEFQLPPVNLEFMRRMPYYTLPKEWNNLGDVRFQSNRTTFIYSLKNILLDVNPAALNVLTTS